jgi:hypothetical protein
MISYTYPFACCAWCNKNQVDLFNTKQHLSGRIDKSYDIVYFFICDQCGESLNDISSDEQYSLLMPLVLKHFGWNCNHTKVLAMTMLSSLIAHKMNVANAVYWGVDFSYAQDDLISKLRSGQVSPLALIKELEILGEERLERVMEQSE